MSARPDVVVLDYGSGNIHSAAKALERAGADVTVTADRQAALAADGLVVPGVGAFRAVMDQLDTVRGGDLVDRRLAGGKPVLGVCVGMQVMFERGVERGSDVPGLGQWPGTIHQLRAEVLPHMGWNTVQPPADSVLFDGLSGERFYFVHSYGATSLDIDAQPPFPAPKVTWAEHGERFVAAVENGALAATQFHPEKSGEPGIALLRNWLRTL
ncbi:MULTISPECIES: imidazole glycerol phosphate synthase subunit HisH [unclassified Curtobacterium]|uniref:imidazole glycerol phosphate synthase subunit HisH n=1 Tax=unclassified Curtobacterium TaxID=257496 RepID=UPI000DA7552A|nr:MULTISPECIES: imidazole glycerol phosphate synthase subunit HisH [unclassified Curtobacterium]PZE25022.1 imidazole glycerol phosphate synthase subunit HisH [Curtobacterium sp. MCBD17_028]PZE73542.1 imidazole glycerol phosphate synthase subunit HisH [Curtobacterium sp. MCBD17_019]PZF56561.1 imidazole glycerol phosphate synthase subunit HisH [Curtobacterium sp. MCBD17_034]PZF60561.1 imidazole glycerol phosphate synthase subunit HisH [Curtobacterium sp. MCBD17_013]PZM33745.1 imidazole glycerol